MRADKAHKTQTAAHRAAQARHSDCSRQQQNRLARNIYTQAGGSLLTQYQHVQSAAFIKDRQQQQGKTDGQQSHVLPVGTPDAAGEPVLHKSIFTVRHPEHQHGGGTGNGCGRCNAHQKQTPGRKSLPCQRKEIVYCRRADGTGKSQNGQQDGVRDATSGKQHDVGSNKQSCTFQPQFVLQCYYVSGTGTTI